MSTYRQSTQTAQALTQDREWMWEWMVEARDESSRWLAGEDGDWMLWLAGRRLRHLPPEHPQRRRLTLAAVECAELVAHQWRADDREVLRRVVDILRRWGEGDPGVTLDDVRAAATDAAWATAAWGADAAYAAADAAYAAADAARATTADDAADDAERTTADDAAADAASAVALAAARATTLADAHAARTQTLRACADIVRRHWPTVDALTAGGDDGQ
jgi:hypothetical protein